jgi:hypothetical protein
VFADVFYPPDTRVVIDAFCCIDQHQQASGANASAGVDVQQLQRQLQLSMAVIDATLRPFVDHQLLVLTSTPRPRTPTAATTADAAKHRSAKVNVATWVLDPKRMLYAARLAVHRLATYKAPVRGETTPHEAVDGRTIMLRCPHCNKMSIDILEFATLERDEAESAIVCPECKKPYTTAPMQGVETDATALRRDCNELLRSTLTPAINGLHTALEDIARTEEDIARRADEFKQMDARAIEAAKRTEQAQREAAKAQMEVSNPLPFKTDDDSGEVDEQKGPKRTKVEAVESQSTQPSQHTSYLDRMTVSVGGRRVSLMQVTNAHVQAMTADEMQVYTRLLADNDIETF